MYRTHGNEGYCSYTKEVSSAYVKRHDRVTRKAHRDRHRALAGKICRLNRLMCRSRPHPEPCGWHGDLKIFDKRLFRNDRSGCSEQANATSQKENRFLQIQTMRWPCSCFRLARVTEVQRRIGDARNTERSRQKKTGWQTRLDRKENTRKRRL